MLDPRLAKAYHTEETLRYLVKAASHPGIIKAAGMDKTAQFPIAMGPGLLPNAASGLLGRLFGPGLQQSLWYQLPSAIMGEIGSRAVRTGWKPFTRGYSLLSGNLGRVAGQNLDLASMFTRGQPFNAPLF